MGMHRCFNDDYSGPAGTPTEYEKANAGKRSLDWVFPFGKYKGLSIGAVIKFNASYIAWLRSDGRKFELTEDAWRDYIEAFKKERQLSYNNQELWAHGFGKGAKRNKEITWSRNYEIEQQERIKAGQTLDDNLNWVQEEGKLNK